MNITKFLDFKKKSVLVLVFGAVATLCALISLIIFCTSFDTVFTRQMIEIYNMHATVISMLVLGMLICGASIVFDFKLLKYAGFIFNLLAFGFYIVFEADYLGSIFSSIDPTEITAAFVLMLVFTAIAAASQLCSAILKKEETV